MLTRTSAPPTRFWKVVAQCTALLMALQCIPDALAADARNVSGNSLQQQVKSVKGTVVDQNGAPLVGVSIKIKGTSTGAVTDLDGHFHLNLSGIQDPVLEVSCISMKSLTVPVDGRQELTIQMEEDSTYLDEVLVVAYGTTTKEAFTGSAVSVKSDKITEAAASKTSAVEALRGNVAGVRFSNTGGQPGDLSGIQIRGIGSINESTAPLYVVDGVTISTSLNMINPEDIESMTVLKDAAATSLYGNRASNGVIIITTKKGKAGKTKVSVNYEHAWSSQSMPNSLKGFYMNNEENTAYAFEALSNRYLYNNKALPWQENYNPNDTAIRDAARNYALIQLHSSAKIVHPDDKLDGKFDYTTADLEKYLTHAKEYNWEDVIFRTAQENKVNINATGGTENLSYYASLGYLNQEGLVVGSEYDRYTGRLSVNGKIGRHIDFTIGENIAYTIKDEQTSGNYYASPMYGIYATNPSQPVYLEDGSLNKTPGYWAQVPNYLSSLEHMSFTYNDFSSITNGTFNVNFTDWLRFSSINGIDINYIQEKQVWDPLSVDGASTNGMVWQYASLYHKMTTSNTLNFNKEFGDHSVNVLGGYEAMKYSYDNFSAEGQQYAYADKMYLGNASVPAAVGGYAGTDRMVSWIAKADYNYANKYYLSASFRRDGTSRFIRKNRWGNFWSVSGAWNITREKFMENASNWLDNLRLKLSYGTNGNQPGSYYNNLNLFSIAARHNLKPAMLASSIGNKDLTWEKSYTWNASVDFSMFNHRFGGTVEYYNRRTTDLIDWTNISYMTGWSSVIVNDGQLRNTGVEITLNSRNIVAGDFLWTTDFNITTMRAKVEKLNGGSRISHPYITQEGADLYSFYTREWVGVDPETGRGTWKKNTKDANGNVIDSESVTHDPYEADRVIVGKGYPDWYGGMTNTFTYKGFELSFLLTFSLGGQMWDDTHYNSVTDGDGLGAHNFRKDAADHWRQPGDISDNPIIIAGNPLESSTCTSTRRLISSDHLRLKTLTFAYNLPKKWMNTIGMAGAKIYVNGNDIFTISASKYVDPEVGLNGMSKNNFAFPMLKSWRIGVKLDF